MTSGDKTAPALLLVLVTLWVSPFVWQARLPGMDPDAAGAGAFWAGDLADVHNPDVVNHYTHLALPRISLFRFGQFPWRTHLVGGGTELIGHPRDVTLSPFFLPALLLGEVAGLKVYTALMFYIAAFGMYYLCRRSLGLGPIGSFYAGALMVVTAWLPTRLRSGNYDEWHFMLFPLILACFREGRRDRRFVIGAAALLYAVLVDGKYILPILFLYLGLFAAAEMAGRVRLWERLKWLAGQVLSLGRVARPRPPERRWWGPAARLAAVTVLVLLLGAVKVVPMLRLLQLDDRTRVDRYANSRLAVSESWLGLDLWDYLPANARSYAELALLEVPPRELDIRWLGLGPTAVLLAAAGLAARPRRLVGWALFALLGMWLSLWWRMPLDLFRLLDRLPLFRSINSPEKYFNWGVLLASAVMGGSLLSALEEERRRLVHVFAAAVVFVALAEPAFHHYHVQARLFPPGLPAPRVQAEEKFYPVLALDSARDLERQYRDWFFIRRGIGVINWYCPLDLPRAAAPKVVVRAERRADDPFARIVLPDRFTETENPAYPGEAHCLIPANSAQVAELTPNRLRIEVAVETSDTLVINQNYDPRWRTDVGRVTWVPMPRPEHLRHEPDLKNPLRYDRTEREFRQLAVALGRPGRYTVTLRFRPWGAYAGAAVSAATWLGCLVLLVTAACRRRRPAPSANT